MKLNIAVAAALATVAVDLDEGTRTIQKRRKLARRYSELGMDDAREECSQEARRLQRPVETAQRIRETLKRIR